MRSRRFIVVMAAAAAAITTTPAGAAPGDTSVTFTVSATDGLNITVPGSVTFGNAVTPGNDATNALGLVAVNDQRSAADTSWMVTVTTTDFATATSPVQTIVKADADYNPGPAISPVNGPFVPGTAGSLAAPRTAFSRPSGSGDNSVSWNPTLTIHVPSTAVLGTYTGTVNHSFA